VTFSDFFDEENIAKGLLMYDKLDLAPWRSIEVSLDIESWTFYSFWLW